MCERLLIALLIFSNWVSNEMDGSWITAEMQDIDPADRMSPYI